MAQTQSWVKAVGADAWAERSVAPYTTHRISRSLPSKVSHLEWVFFISYLTRMILPCHLQERTGYHQRFDLPTPNAEQVAVSTRMWGELRITGWKHERARKAVLLDHHKETVAASTMGAEHFNLQLPVENLPGRYLHSC